MRLIGVVTGNRGAFEAMVRAMAANQLKPVVDARGHGFGELRAVLEAQPPGCHFGRVCNKC